MEAQIQLSRKNKSAIDNLMGLFNNVFVNKGANVSKTSRTESKISDRSMGFEDSFDLDLSSFELFESNLDAAKINDASDGLVRSLNAYGRVDVEYIANITNKTVNIKHIKKLQMLVDIPATSNMRVYILYDDEEFDKNTSHLVYTSHKSGRHPIRVKPRKTANYGFKLHFEGTGYIKLYELEIFVETGGDMYV